MASPEIGPKPPEDSKRQQGGLRRHWLHWFTTYRVLISLTFSTNFVVAVLLIPLHLPLDKILLPVSANLLASILVRQENVVNFGYWLIAKLPPTLPLGIRKRFADFHHYGGVHIGCALSALLWYIFFIISNTIHFVSTNTMTASQWADITTCYAFLLLILYICITSIPCIREKHHNGFESTHRFGGWASLATLWIHVGIHGTIDTTSHLHTNPSNWFLALSTLLIILPWLRIQRIPITTTHLTPHSVKITFPTPNMRYTSTVRISLSPLREWHAFATIPANDGFTASIIVAAAGDWTTNLIHNTPPRLWMRKPALKNFLTLAPLFNSVLLVATGAGIGPMLSLLCSPAMAQMQAAGKTVRVMWCVYNAHADHWAFVREIIYAVDPVPVFVDSKSGRADIAFEAKVMARECGVEAVMVVSNRVITGEVVRECKADGGAAYGAVFDS
ncbi:hypothetical protein GQ44DRAFT_752326 [Phaeosphaeriaceae sp. PMI808]|nr:hypothetical protein GQ44DRAFT_752326 [Phaeosphaeriaceae sp. PMI808]